MKEDIQKYRCYTNGNFKIKRHLKVKLMQNILMAIFTQLSVVYIVLCYCFVLFGFIMYWFLFSLFVASKPESSFWEFDILKRQNKLQQNPNITWRTKLNEVIVCGRENVLFKVYSMTHMRQSFPNLWYSRYF